ncbi:hypothetical protein L6452_08723 [Arctium lappa]|uniref:Uncharacterized protein n=1 Tax=Arctium lappa TaxID=4217 RepID=A0ACB9DIH9_ARCLA|nr:hypothetical protein L6452_08723 [Arctium lappa]
MTQTHHYSLHLPTPTPTSEDADYKLAKQVVGILTSMRSVSGELESARVEGHVEFILLFSLILLPWLSIPSNYAAAGHEASSPTDTRLKIRHRIQFGVQPTDIHLIS